MEEDAGQISQIQIYLMVLQIHITSILLVKIIASLNNKQRQNVY